MLTNAGVGGKQSTHSVSSAIATFLATTTTAAATPTSAATTTSTSTTFH